jgi:Mg-chelatase subunit ChlI
MAQDLAPNATGLSFTLSALLGRMQTEQPGAPLSISSTQKTEAERALVAAEAALQPAPQALAERFVTALGTLTATRPGEADGLAKVRAYAAMLEFPASAFTRSSLDAAARKFRWFPSYAELVEHLEAEVAQAKALRHQLRRAVALPVEGSKPSGKYSAMTDAQKAEFDAAMAKFRSRFASDASRSAEDGSGTPEAR